MGDTVVLEASIVAVRSMVTHRNPTKVVPNFAKMVSVVDTIVDVGTGIVMESVI